MSGTVIVDYGLGNLGSVSRALRWLGDDPVITDAAGPLKEADRLVLPGDGAFGYGMRQLEERGLLQPVLDFIVSGRQFLGICIGMQLLLSESTEFGHHRGMGIIPGQVVPIPPHPERIYKIPHIGWAALHPAGSEGTAEAAPAPETWRQGILRDVRPGQEVYFVHSFLAVPDDPAYRVANAAYGGQEICAVVRRDNVTGCQFHPEKSGPVGLRILRAFLEAGRSVTPARPQGVPA